MKKFLLLIFLSSLIIAQSGEGNFTSEQEYLFNVFKNRRSVRNFKNTPVPKEHLDKILDIARCAPTSGNQQPWKFLVIQDRGKLDLLKEKAVDRRVQRAKEKGVIDEEQINRVREKAEKYFTTFLSAPVYVSVLVDSGSTYPGYNRYDGSVAAGYLMIAARALGYGTVFSQDSVPYELIAEVFEIPQQFEQICFTPIGIPVEWPKTPLKKEFSQFVVNEKFVEGENYIKRIVHKEIKISDKKLQEYEGNYEAGQYKIDIKLDNHVLVMTFDGSGSIEILPFEEDKFFIKTRNVEINFHKEEGTVKKFIWKQGGTELEGIKK